MIRAALLALWLPFGLALAQPAPQDESVPASGYAPTAGESFFVLADASYASDEIARVRLEAPGRDYRRYAMEGYGGVDMRVYRIERPLEFLQRQKNLHRVQVDPEFRGEGLANALSYLWDRWYRQSRRAMQRAFSSDARRSVIDVEPALSMGDAIAAPTRFDAPTQFAPIAGLPLVSEFRYPIWDARPIQPPEGVSLQGSSSEFTPIAEGNVHIPLGKLKPGLYLVEAIVGGYRATTVVFVSNTVAITKIAGTELLVWTARKHEGTAVPGARVLWTDGVGTLTEGRTDARGLLRLTHASPERSYVLGEDAEGGVFVSENFYYDSEIYDTKLYAFTDRPLYRPGDRVEVKILAREFTDARTSIKARSAPIALTVRDANGTELQTLDLAFDADRGANAHFQLPDNATAGGYELRMRYRDQLYSSAFRVAEYVKPHFEIVLDLDADEYRAGQAVEGTVSLLYPDGRPVVNAGIELTLRAQQLSMVDNELQYLGQFPVQLSATTLRSDSQGRARVVLPAADKPSRYLLTLFASDGAAYRVRSTREILIERGAASYRIDSARHFSAADETVEFRIAREGEGGREAARYEWVRLEDQQKDGAALAPGAASFSVRFTQPGTYNLMLLDARGMIVGATGHTVSGKGVKATPGSIGIVFDRDEYVAGDTAEALITFPETVRDALLTLERDRVEADALLGQGGNWLQLARINDTQYRARIPVAPDFSPNVTFSVLYTRGGEYSFQNAGIRVKVPEIDVVISTDRELYRPGDTVTVSLQTQRDGRAMPARLAVSVVDEMIYALQPEIAPSIGDFFHHPRRNNVRTSASLSFIAYDVALPGRATTPPSVANRSERGIKVLERPRREDVDTAAWHPDLATDAQGRASFSFRMPDSLTRWRITARAVDDEGRVGQKRQFLRSEKPLYLKWSGPQHFRAGDQPRLGVLAFNQGRVPAQAELVLRANGSETLSSVTLMPGATWLPLEPLRFAAGEVVIELRQQGQPVDALTVALHHLADAGHRQSLALDLVSRSTPLALPADARNLELRLASGSAALFRNALDDLLEYPWGCVEQTASRLLPLAIAYPQLTQGDARIADRLRLAMQDSRLRLVQMAGPNARFAWWGDSADEDLFLTAYAYYADWHASRSLGLSLPAEHWQRVLDLYSEKADATPALQRVLTLDAAQRMQLPVRSLLHGVLEGIAEQHVDSPSNGAVSRESPSPDGDDSQRYDPMQGIVLDAPDSEVGRDLALVLAARLAADIDLAVPARLSDALTGARERLTQEHAPFVRAALLPRNASDAVQARALIADLAPEHATLERALVLSWLHDSAAGTTADTPLPGDGWLPRLTASGETRWRWRGDALPTALDLQREPSSAMAARLSFDSDAPTASSLPVTIERRLYELVPGDDAFSFTAREVGGDALSSDRLYLDQLTVRSSAAQPLRYGLVEVPLPAGADLERTTWGISVSGLGGDGAAELEKARFEAGNSSYVVPIDTLSGDVVFRHLLRFSQRGQLTLPPARYFRMYAPDQQAVEATPGLSRVTVE